MIGKILNAGDYTKKLKATIHRTGKLGFTKETADELKLSENLFVRFANDSDDRNIVYLAIIHQEIPGCFKLLKSSDYYSVSTGKMFKELGFDYSRRTVMFDVEREISGDEIMGGECYKLSKRDRKEDKKIN